MPKQVYLIVASQSIEELRKAPETHLSQPAAANIIFQTKHTFHPALEHDTYHFDVVKIKLAQALGQNLLELVDEAKWAFSAELGSASEWTEQNMASLSSKVVTRVVDRMLFGLDLCRNDNFLQFSSTVTGDVFATAVKLRNYPEFMKSAIMFLFTDRKEQQQRARKYLRPVIENRIAEMVLDGKAADGKFKSEKKHNDARKCLCSYIGDQLPFLTT